MRHSAQRDTLAPSVRAANRLYGMASNTPVRCLIRPASRLGRVSLLASGSGTRVLVRDVSFPFHMLRGCLLILFLSPCARSVPDLREPQKAVVSVRRAHTPLCAPPMRCISRRARSTAVHTPRMRPNASRRRDSGNHPESPERTLFAPFRRSARST